MKKNFTINFSLSYAKLFGIVLPAAIVVLALGMLAGVAIVDRMIMPNIVGVNKGIVQVPSIVNQPYEQGRERLYGVGLRTRLLSREFDAAIPAGQIIRQFPVPGTDVKKGRQIDVVVSRGSEVATMPEITGLSERQARIKLDKQGFSIGTIRKLFSQKVPVDYIVTVEPPEGSKTSRALPVELVVSKGPRPTHAIMPNVIGETLSIAKEKIADSGLSIGGIEYREKASLKPGTIISQSAAPGTNVSLDQSISLVVSVSR